MFYGMIYGVTMVLKGMIMGSYWGIDGFTIWIPLGIKRGTWKSTRNWGVNQKITRLISGFSSKPCCITGGYLNIRRATYFPEYHFPEYLDIWMWSIYNFAEYFQRQKGELQDVGSVLSCHELHALAVSHMHCAVGTTCDAAPPHRIRSVGLFFAVPCRRKPWRWSWWCSKWPQWRRFGVPIMWVCSRLGGFTLNIGPLH